MLMKKYFFPAVALLLFTGCFSSCKKDCVCTVTRTTPTTIDTETYDMGKMDDEDCQKYTSNVSDGDGVTRTLTCSLKK